VGLRRDRGGEWRSSTARTTGVARFVTRVTDYRATTG
jgi:hypothetical protein